MEFEISTDLRKHLRKIKENKIAKALLELKKINKINYLDFSKDIEGNLSYLTTDKISKLKADEYWTSKTRITAKCSRVIEKLFDKTYTDVEKQEFTTSLKTKLLSVSLSDDYITVVEGEDIRYWYLEDNYYQDKGDLGSSCKLQPIIVI